MYIRWENSLFFSLVSSNITRLEFPRNKDNCLIKESTNKKIETNQVFTRQNLFIYVKIME
jgi:hypothetical protein